MGCWPGLGAGRRRGAGWDGALARDGTLAGDGALAGDGTIGYIVGTGSANYTAYQHVLSQFQCLAIISCSLHFSTFVRSRSAFTTRFLLRTHRAIFILFVCG